ncbi:hypothetical protein LDENG_00140760, partial [Lucifuga dentata]
LLLFYRSVIEPILTFSITVWFSNITTQKAKQLERILRTASRIIGTKLPALKEIHESRLKKLGLKILKDLLHHANSLFKFLPSGKKA